MARYMKNNVPGILVPDEYIDRMTAAGKPWAGIPKDKITRDDKRERSKAWRETGIQICVELIQQLREIEGVAGAHIMAIEWEEAVKPIAEGANLLPRPVMETAAV
jgi:methylenetetrahydrofolate reductase (NADPH)